MATMVHDEQTGERTFHVPFDQTIPGGPFHGRSELLIATASPGDRPTRLALRFFPTAYEFQVKLPRLVEEGQFDVYPPDLSRAAQEAQPVVVYQADAALLAAVPRGLSDLPGLEAFLGERPPLFDLGRYALAAIEFEPLAGKEDLEDLP
ncbi:MAG: hypothetical protein JWM80_4422 [Cyanobacteria bacterium RYN_339]|nr:hypothetical protein [Cyanobacteria bacterium RYN_339]